MEARSRAGWRSSRVEAHPRERAGVALGPLREHGGLPVAGRGDQQRDGELAGLQEAAHRRGRGTSPAGRGGGSRRTSVRCAPPSSTDTAGPAVPVSKSGGFSARRIPLRRASSSRSARGKGAGPRVAVGEHHPRRGGRAPAGSALGVHEAFANRPEGGLRARAEAELAEDVRHVRAGGSLADSQLGGDLLVRLARAHEPQDLELARRELRARVVAWSRAGARTSGAERSAGSSWSSPR